MFFSFFVLFASCLVASIAGAPTNDLASAAVARADPHPKLKHMFTLNINASLPDPRLIKIPEGFRLDVSVIRGNLTNPDGSLLATIVSGLGGEQGFVDLANVAHLDVRYSVQFVADKKYGYVQHVGFGVSGVSNKGIATIESDSVAATGLLDRTFYAPGHVVGGEVLVAPYWAFV